MKLPTAVVIATSNPGKRAEWCTLLAALEVAVADETVQDFPEEVGNTYAENAILKAVTAARQTGLPAIGDDVGLEVDALGGEPGLWTRRWAEARGGWGPACIALVATAAGSRATYLCGTALAHPGGPVFAATGRVQGTIVIASGDGPGFEPIFQPDGVCATLAQLRGSERDALHHRPISLRALLRIAKDLP